MCKRLSISVWGRQTSELDAPEVLTRGVVKLGPESQHFWVREGDWVTEVKGRMEGQGLALEGTEEGGRM